MSCTGTTKLAIGALGTALVAVVIGCGEPDESLFGDSRPGVSPDAASYTDPTGDQGAGTDGGTGGGRDGGNRADGTVGTDAPHGADAEVDTGPVTGECDQSGEGYWNPSWAVLECQVLAIVNQERAKGANCRTEGVFGPVGPLTMEAHLRKAARLHSQDMGQRNFFAHDSPGGPNGNTVTQRINNAGYHGSSYGENIARGQKSPTEVMQAWMASDGHCANIMSPRYIHIGVGYAVVAGSPGPYWTQDFGHP